MLVGRDNDQAFGSNARAWGGSSMAFGNNAKAANGGAIAMGNGSQSRGDWGVAIGNGAKALAAGARALGANSTAKGVNSTAIGWDSKSEADRGIAIGETASVEDGTEHGIAIGTGAKASGKGSTGTPSLPASTVAIGQGAQALENGDIVIGRQAKSIASTEHGNPGSGAVVAGAEAAAYGARGDVVSARRRRPMSRSNSPAVLSILNMRRGLLSAVRQNLWYPVPRSRFGYESHR